MVVLTFLLLLTHNYILQRCEVTTSDWVGETSIRLCVSTVDSTLVSTIMKMKYLNGFNDNVLDSWLFCRGNFFVIAILILCSYCNNWQRDA